MQMDLKKGIITWRLHDIIYLQYLQRLETTAARE